MNLKKFKLDSYNKIIDDYKNNQDIYMFFLYPLIIKLKTKDFKDYKYSIFLKLKNKQPVPFKEYTKKNLDKDIKIIIKCIFWSDYIDKNNIYAIYYLKKHLSTKKQTSINLINLLYRLLTNAPTKITGGAMFENSRKNLGSKVKELGSKVVSNVKELPNKINFTKVKELGNKIIEKTNKFTDKIKDKFKFKDKFNTDSNGDRSIRGITERRIPKNIIEDYINKIIENTNYHDNDDNKKYYSLFYRELYIKNQENIQFIENIYSDINTIEKKIYNQQFDNRSLTTDAEKERITMYINKISQNNELVLNTYDILSKQKKPINFNNNYQQLIDINKSNIDTIINLNQEKTINETIIKNLDYDLNKINGDIIQYKYKIENYQKDKKEKEKELKNTELKKDNIEINPLINFFITKNFSLIKTSYLDIFKNDIDSVHEIDYFIQLLIDDKNITDLIENNDEYYRLFYDLYRIKNNINNSINEIGRLLNDITRHKNDPNQKRYLNSKESASQNETNLEKEKLHIISEYNKGEAIYDKLINIKKPDNFNNNHDNLKLYYKYTDDILKYNEEIQQLSINIDNNNGYIIRDNDIIKIKTEEKNNITQKNIEIEDKIKKLDNETKEKKEERERILIIFNPPEYRIQKGGNTKIQNTKLKLLIQHIISHLS